MGTVRLWRASFISGGKGGGGVAHQGLGGLVGATRSAAGQQVDVHDVALGVDRYPHHDGTLPPKLPSRLGVGPVCLEPRAYGGEPIRIRAGQGCLLRRRDWRSRDWGRRDWGGRDWGGRDWLGCWRRRGGSATDV